MKRICLFLFASLIISVGSVDGKAPKARKTFDNPDCKTNNTSVIKLNRAEFFNDSTRLHFSARFNSGMWIKVDTNFVLEINGGTYQPIASHGIELGKMFVMPESGYSEFSLIYPAVKGKLSTMDLIERGSSWRIYDIRLDGKRYERLSAEKWMADNHADYPGEDNTLIYDNPLKSIFKGVISGYDPRTCGDNIMMYDEDELTSTEKPIAIQINTDGSFETELSMRMPKYINLALGNHSYFKNLYFEPGRNLSVFIDLENDKTYYGGELGLINEQLEEAPEFWGYRSIPELTDSVAMDQAIRMIESKHETYQKIKNEFLNRDDIHPFVKKLVNNEELSGMICTMLDHDMTIRFSKKGNQEKPDVFWKYIRDNMENPIFPRTSRYSTIINRMMFINPVNVAMEYPTIIGDRGLDYLKNNGFKLTDEEERLRSWIEEHDGEERWLTRDSVNLINSSPYKVIKRCGGSAEHEGKVDELLRNQATSEEGYGRAEARHVIRTARAIADYYGSENAPLWWQIMKASSLGGSSMSPEKLKQRVALHLLSQLKDNSAITYDGIYNALYDFYMSAYTPMALPDNETGRLVKSMIEPYKGKYVMMDLWATSCGPCRSYIMQTHEFRQKNANNPNFAIVFVTEDSLSPKEHYDEFVGKYMRGEDSHYISSSQYHRLRELFAFNGIPHYVMFDRDGNLISKDFFGYSLQGFLKRNGVTFEECEIRF